MWNNILKYKTYAFRRMMSFKVLFLKKWYTYFSIFDVGLTPKLFFEDM